MGQNCIEVCLSAVVDSGELLAHLQGGDATGAWEDAGLIHLYWPEDLWSEDTRLDLEAALRRLGSSCQAAGFQVREVADRDWNEAWTKSLRPILIGGRVLVRQSWNSAEVPSGGFELIIDPRRAFGSGYHATSQLLVEWMVEKVRRGDRVLDLGTGSGILAMTALRLGAVQAVGIDNDPEAIECARENADQNSFGAELELRIRSIEEIGTASFDLIVANIDRKTLLTQAAGFRRNLAHGGRLLLSGLQVDDLADMSEALASGAGRVIASRRRDEWLAIEVIFE